MQNSKNDSKLWGHLTDTWGIGERVIPEMMVDDPLNQNILEISFRHYEIASSFVVGKRVLDIACGTGYGSQILAKAGAMTTIGVDVCEETIEYACNHYLSANVEFICADAEQYTESQPFEVICSFETIEHLYNPERFLQNVYQLLVPQGYLILSVPLGETRHIDPYHLHKFSQQSICSLVEAAGFVIELYRYDQFQMTRSDVIRTRHIYPSAQPSWQDLILTKRGWHSLFNLLFKGGFFIPQFMLTARKREPLIS